MEWPWKLSLSCSTANCEDSHGLAGGLLPLVLGEKMLFEKSNFWHSHPQPWVLCFSECWSKAFEAAAHVCWDGAERRGPFSCQHGCLMKSFPTPLLLMHWEKTPVNGQMRIYQIWHIIFPQAHQTEAAACASSVTATVKALIKEAGGYILDPW